MRDHLHLFLIEDDGDTSFLMRRALERAGHQVTGCRTAAEALVSLRRHHQFDLILLDNSLPDMTGVELLHAMERDGISAPVLMVTGYGDEELATRVLRAGVLDYLVKDVGKRFLEELPKRVKESFNTHQLQQTNRLLVVALESTQDGVLITDANGTITHVNQALERMTGYSREELIGQNPRILKSGAHQGDVYEKIWAQILTNGSWQGELTNRRKDGSLFDVSLSISSILSPQGRLTHFVGIERDITSLKQLQQQLLQAQKMQSVGNLAGGVAHEFNNILAGISGYAALGMRDDEAGMDKEFFKSIVELSERAAKLTRQLLAFARRPALLRHAVSLAPLLESSRELFGHTINHELRIEVSPSEAHSLTVNGDSNQLQQVLLNLVLNARDAMKERGVITLRLRSASLPEGQKAHPEPIPAGDYAVIEVEDSGCGMSPQVMAQALDPFFTTKDVGHGTGLGLPMAYGIVRGHQGFLDIRSEPGKGTCVAVYLPRLQQPAGHSKSEENWVAPFVLGRERLRALAAVAASA